MTETSTPSVSTEALDSGALISGRYEIISLIGSGGMASVYLADDRQLGMRVALKVLHTSLTSDRKYVDRFLREARLMNLVRHPNVVHTFDVGGGEGLVYFSMEFVDGATLESLVEAQRFTPEEIADLTAQIVQGLDAVHEHGISHRDLKPGNILITAEGIVKITDFGVAHEEGSRLTERNQRVGSVCYIAPELWSGERPTPAADFYSLGIILYELSTGRLPFNAAYPGAYMICHLEQKIEPPKERDASVPDWLNELVMKLLVKSPGQRLQSGKEVLALLAKRHLEQARKTAPEPAPSRIQQVVADLRAQPPSATQGQRRGKTYILNLNATKLLDASRLGLAAVSMPRRRITVPLPRHAAIVFEIEPPSRDFIYFGVFLASLQVCDGFLTAQGIARWGLSAEANPMLRGFMETYGAHQTLFLLKAATILLVVIGTIVAKRVAVIKDLIKFLSCFYLTAAIIPWIYLLYIRH